MRGRRENLARGVLWCGEEGQSTNELRLLPTISRSFPPRAPVPTGAFVCELVTSQHDASCELEGRRATEGVRAFFFLCALLHALSHSHRRRSLLLAPTDVY